MSDAGLLTLVQWLSPAFPVGGFAYSHGLEVAIADRSVRTVDEVSAWIGDLLAYGSARVDAVLLAEGLQTDADHAALAGTAIAMAASKERLAETLEQGRAFARTTNALTGADHPEAPLPVAVAAAARSLGLRPEQVLALYLNAFASNLVQVAVRFVPLGQTDGQRILRDLHPLIRVVAAEALKMRLCDVTWSTFGADRASMAHEVLEVRIFKT
jgi:urease accessory protein